ncbi:MAG: SDR family oxidoreductase [Candidatus Hydrogenedentales bacterium]|jgi:NAD(P)-dependent dehydrogenase (short-subunit alcohol dehydrogenase family)
MAYFVTGGTGFIGSHLLERLVRRKGTIDLLVRKDSEQKAEELRKRFGVNAKLIVSIHGDLEKDHLGLKKEQIAKLKGQITHFFHLAAFYNLLSENENLENLVNVQGTRRAVELANLLQAKCFHQMSSIAVAGEFRGYWREDMFKEAENLRHPYFRAKHDAEGIVRRECAVPWRIYRPGIVAGHSKTGEMGKVDGPYYFFKFIQKIRKVLPSWVPLIGLEGGRINIVPVDYVADTIDHIAHKRGLNKRCFHVTDPEPFRAGEILNLFAKAAHAPQFVMRIDSRMFDIVPKGILDGVLDLPPIRRIIDTFLKDIGIPREALRYLNYPTRFDCRDTLKELEGTGIRCPNLSDYAPMLWDYWERNLDPDLHRDRTLASAVKDKVVLITGASSGIGRAAALKIAAAGGTPLIASRSLEKLRDAQQEIEANGGKVCIYQADISDMESCDRLIDQILKDHGRVDILVNNAGRSIRRSIKQSYDRFHDFERTMQLNYFGAVKLILKVMPGMAERRCGHIINVSTIGVLANSPRFSAYTASKSALDTFSRCVQAEFLDKDIKFTTINMPLVRTPMISPTSFYEHVPALTPEEAADMVCEAIVEQPKRIATRLGIFAQVMTTLFPNLADVILNTAYKLFPDTDPAKGDEATGEDKPSSEAVVFAALMRGIYW